MVVVRGQHSEVSSLLSLWELGLPGLQGSHLAGPWSSILVALTFCCLPVQSEQGFGEDTCDRKELTERTVLNKGTQW